MSLQLGTLNLHGYTVANGMARFIEEYNRVLAGGKLDGLEVIHGKGRNAEGGLREALRALLRSQGTRIKGFDAQLAMRGASYLLDGPGKLAYMHGEDATHNGGCTIVVPKQKIQLPPEWAWHGR
jgi:hypothetical protein